MRGWMGMAAVATGVALASSPATATVIYQGSGVAGETGWLPEIGLTAAPGVTYYLELKTSGPVIQVGILGWSNYEYFYYREDGTFDYANNNPGGVWGGLTQVGDVYSGYFGPVGEFYSYWENGNLKKHGKTTMTFFLDAKLAPGAEYSYLLESVPEPTTWALMIVGFGLTGAALRRRSPARSVARAEVCS